MNGDVTNAKSPKQAMALVFALALAVRAAAAIALFGSLEEDPDAYRRLAENVRLRGVYSTTGPPTTFFDVRATGSDPLRNLKENELSPGDDTTEVSPTAFRPPLYPLLLTMTVFDGKVSSVAVAALHVVLGAATVLLTFLLAETCGLKRGAYLAAALVAIDPILLNQSALVMTETLATLLAVAGMFALTRVSQAPTPTKAAVAGACLGLAALCRPTFLPWLAVSGVLLGCRWLLPFGGKSASPEPPRGTTPNGPQNIRAAAVYFVVAALVISPWAVRNLVVLGKPKLTTTHGGYTVLLGNNPSFYQYLRERKPGETWDSAPLASVWKRRQASKSPEEGMWDLIQADAINKNVHTLDDDDPIYESDTPVVRSEFEDDAFAYSLAWHYISEEPQMFVYACRVRVGRLWQLFPYPRSDSESSSARALRLLTGCWYTLLFLLAAAGAVACRRELLRSPLVWGVLLCLSFTTVHAVYWSNMRMRAPLMPLVCLLASLATAEIAGRLRRRKL